MNRLQGPKGRGSRWAAFALLAALAFWLACVSERGLEPAPQKYRLYISDGSFNGRIFVAETETDSLIDSSGVSANSLTRSVVSPDGMYLLRRSAFTCPDILDANSLLSIGELPGCASQLVFVGGDNLILAFYPRRIDCISYPGFVLLHSDSLTLNESPTMTRPVLDEELGLAYTILRFGGTSVDRWEVMAWDYRNRTVWGQWNLSDAFPGGQFQVNSLAIQPGKALLYGLGGSSEASYAFCYNLQDEGLVWSRRILTSFGYLRFTPDVCELWRADRGNVLWPLITGYVYVHDPLTGAVWDSISLYGYLDHGAPLSAQEMVFTPDGEKAYVAAGNTQYSTGPVLVIDVRKREVVNLILDDYEHFPYYVEMGPIP
jgi:hypothetical protein